MVKVVIEDFVAVLRVLHGEVVARTNKEEIADHVSDHLLVEVAVIDMLPVGVLESCTLMMTENCVCSNLEDDGIFL